MRKLLFTLYFTKTRKERVINTLLGIIPVISLFVGFYLLYGKVSPWYFLPFAVSFLFDNIYYTDEEINDDDWEENDYDD